MKIENILLVTDAADDKLLFSHALAKVCPGAQLHFLRDAVEAIEWLHGRSYDTLPALPDLIITDLQMPRADGFDLLRFRRGDEELCTVPMIVISGSHRAGAVRAAYELGASAVFTMPATLSGLTSMLKSICAHWEMAEGPAHRAFGPESHSLSWS